MTDYIMTIDSDTEDFAGDTGDVLINPDFVFDATGDSYQDIIANDSFSVDLTRLGTKLGNASVDDIIARRKISNKRKREELAFSDSESEDGGVTDNDNESSTADPLSTSEEEGEEENLYGSNVDEHSESSEGESDVETLAEKEKRIAFFDTENSETQQEHKSFLRMNLSRPLLKAITAMGFQTPTPIQAAAIPVGLLGKDVVGNAVTGSGKTAAFIVPVIERLLYREKGKKAAATRCLVLVPTRELAVQCYEVGTKLAAHTDIRFCLIVGGLSLKSQEASLRSRPDIVIATPGRLIDHIHNSPSFTLDTIDVLILDEADRMLSDGFSDELTEIIKSCPSSRQTMLFSATMTDSVDELVKMSLNKPVRLFVDPKKTMARGLVQEFVRVRAGKEAERSAILVTLCKKSFKSRVIVFLRSKKLAHQMRIVFGLLGMKAGELHGDLSQEQRLAALQAFRTGATDFLMATDLASRGLDIKGVETVINYDMPGQLAQYLHRVGRTARAGRQGRLPVRSVTLVGEADRKMLKSAVRHSSSDDQIRHRIVPADAIAKWAEKLETLKSEIADILKEEKQEKQLRQAEMELQKGQNMIEHEEEIFSRPARSWFQSSKEKATAKSISKQQYEEGFKPKKQVEQAAKRLKRDKFSGLSRRAKRRKMAQEEDEELGDKRSLNAAIRSAKKAARPTKIGLTPPTRIQNGKARKDKQKKSVRGFEREMNGKGKRSTTKTGP
ncbi:hypothetical protein AX16_009549 [Volvariella volvacea WC 439]|nr:hypothetical protein AX16_009549 [Volvariella volvacea WC 439]